MIAPLQRAIALIKNDRHYQKAIAHKQAIAQIKSDRPQKTIAIPPVGVSAAVHPFPRAIAYIKSDRPHKKRSPVINSDRPSSKA
jgi:hypothetical protein